MRTYFLAWCLAALAASVCLATTDHEYTQQDFKDLTSLCKLLNVYTLGNQAPFSPKLFCAVKQFVEPCEVMTGLRSIQMLNYLEDYKAKNKKTTCQDICATMQDITDSFRIPVSATLIEHMGCSKLANGSRHKHRRHLHQTDGMSNSTQPTPAVECLGTMDAVNSLIDSVLPGLWTKVQGEIPNSLAQSFKLQTGLGPYRSSYKLGFINLGFSCGLSAALTIDQVTGLGTIDEPDINLIGSATCPDASIPVITAPVEGTIKMDWLSFRMSGSAGTVDCKAGPIPLNIKINLSGWANITGVTFKGSAGAVANLTDIAGSGDACVLIEQFNQTTLDFDDIDLHLDNGGWLVNDVIDGLTNVVMTQKRSILNSVNSLITKELNNNLSIFSRCMNVGGFFGRRQH